MASCEAIAKSRSGQMLDCAVVTGSPGGSCTFGSWAACCRRRCNSQGKGQDMDLTGKLLIAMPGIGDPRFEHSVIFLCSHSEDGAMGLIINKVAPEVQLGNLLEQLEIPVIAAGKGEEAIRFGGPVEVQRGFVLHSPEYESSINSLTVPPGYGMTATLDVQYSDLVATGILAITGGEWVGKLIADRAKK
mgnify:CR=1 FL=1